MDVLADRYLTNFDVKMVYRTDRFGRGGDQVEMLEAGYPAVRITEGAENYDHQHQDLRTENGKFYGDTIDGRRLRLSGPGGAAEHRHHGRPGLGPQAADRRQDRRGGRRPTPP
jgi:hypothetical protein